MLTPMNLINAHERVFGTKTRRMPAADGNGWEYKTEFPALKSKAVWRELALNAITKRADDPSKRKEHFTVDKIGPVCARYWSRAYGIRDGTANKLLA
eukprot:6196408-Pleurochrysis_carterae.AAC.3